MEMEVANIQSNSELVDKYIMSEKNPSITWQDNELMDTKEIFIKTMEFIRNFEYEPGDINRRIRFNMSPDPNSLVLTLANLGELHLPSSQATMLNSSPLGTGGPPLNSSGFGNSNNGGNTLSPNAGSALMRSKSDHRLTTQYRGAPDEDEWSSGTRNRRAYGDDESSGPGERKSRFRSRFTRHLDSSFEEPDMPTGNRVRFEGPPKDRERVLDTEDVTKGPISGITRLFDSPRVIQRLAEMERGPKILASQQPPVVQIMQQPKTGAGTPAVVPPAPWRRQLSEDDEIAKQKKQSKLAEQETKSPVVAPSVPKRGEQDHETPASTNNNGNESTTGHRGVTKLAPERYPKKRSESEDSGSSESATSSGSASVGTG